LIFSKAKEIFDLLGIKCAGIAATLNDSAKVLLCIDISCEQVNIPFEESAGMKLSGMRKTSYKNYRNNFMKLLNLNKKLGIPEMILKLGVTSSNVEKTAKKILDAYKKESFEADMDHPQFIVMSIYQACKLEKVKAPKRNFVSASNLKPNQWSLLEKSWDKWTAGIGKSTKESSKVKQAEEEESAGKPERSLKRKHAEPEVEDYDTWAKRTVEQAQKDLKLQSSKA
jgi:transcription initiation factor TFIIIB Brf1 subunit/transcription initiation factor TFIIB